MSPQVWATSSLGNLNRESAQQLRDLGLLPPLREPYPFPPPLHWVHNSEPVLDEQLEELRDLGPELYGPLNVDILAQRDSDLARIPKLLKRGWWGDVRRAHDLIWKWATIDRGAVSSCGCPA